MRKGVLVDYVFLACFRHGIGVYIHSTAGTR